MGALGAIFCMTSLGRHLGGHVGVGPLTVYPTNVTVSAVVRFRPGRQASPRASKCGVPGSRLPPERRCEKVRAADSDTKVSKPVLFRPKMPDFRGVHKRKIFVLIGLEVIAEITAP